MFDDEKNSIFEKGRDSASPLVSIAVGNNDKFFNKHNKEPLSAQHKFQATGPLSPKRLDFAKSGYFKIGNSIIVGDNSNGLSQS